MAGAVTSYTATLGGRAGGGGYNFGELLIVPPT